MKNKKGFTLIELLAVIVVLAIIALIATPIVMNTIKNAKKGAAERTADNYIKQVETAVAESRIDGTKIANGTYNIQPDGNLCPTAGCGENDKDKITIDMSGNKPSGGTIKISNGGVSKEGITMIVGDYDVKYNQEKNKYEATEKGNTSLICNLQEGTSQTTGAKYICHLDSDRTFYVLETSEENVSLIMDRNFTDDTISTIAWCIDGGSDNTTCKNINSKEEGTPLKHIQDTFGENVIVSFLTTNQLYRALPGGTQTWIYGNLSPNEAPIAYWTASPTANISSHADYVNYDGELYSMFVYDSNEVGIIISKNFGVRPVITISKSNLN